MTAGDNNNNGISHGLPCCGTTSTSSSSDSINLEILIDDQSNPSENGEKRARWASKIPYVLTLIGYTIGFGDVWRFSHILHSNGGVAFLVPYTVLLFLEGVPLFLLELTIGQRMRMGAEAAFSQISPYLAGIGLTTGIICYVVGFYYNLLSAWVLAYFIDSLRSELPWKNCSTATNFNLTLLPECELTGQASKYYWYNHLLKISSGIEDSGEWNWYMAMCIIGAWIVVWLILLKGISTMQIVVYFTSTLPLLTFVCILVANHFLDGWEYGYTILWNPDWSVIYDPAVWLTAATQTFFSLGLAFGSLIVFASFNPATNDCHADAVTVTVINTVVSLLACVAVFPVLGSQGYKRFSECERRQVNDSSLVCDLDYEVRNSGGGTGLLFIAFAEAANQMPWFPPFWSALFYFALYLIGINSTYGTIEGAIMAVMDMKIVAWPRWVVTSLITGSLTAFSLVYAAGWGYYILDFFDVYFANWTLIVVAFLEVVSVGWGYGLARFSYDLKLMTGQKPSKLMLVCLRYFSPSILILLFGFAIYQMFDEDGFMYNRYNEFIGDIEKSEYPFYVIAIGFLIPIATVLCIPAHAFILWRKNKTNPNTVSERQKQIGGIVSDFPEDELRKLRGIENDSDVELLFDNFERKVIGDKNMEKLWEYLRQRNRSLESNKK
ncbi:unnamed protein product [Orchesella dallaii]|uniref:Uncharacterized protein n=1 Tax=Orchesella dallaii TaxID=48710 RepID=A0ABP1RQB6_9HEXA